MSKAMKAKPAKGEKRPNRPMPADPKDLARAMFRQGDIKMFGGTKAPCSQGARKAATLAGITKA